MSHLPVLISGELFLIGACLSKQIMKSFKCEPVVHSVRVTIQTSGRLFLFRGD